MIIRQEQLRVRYRNLFPLNETKTNLEKLLQLNIENPKKVFIESNSINYKAIFFSILLKYIQKYDKLPTMEYISGLNLSELFFLQGSGDLSYTDLNSFRSDILTLNYSIVEPPSKKTVDLIGYLMHNYTEIRRKSVWVFTRPDITLLKDIARELNYSIIDLDSILKGNTQSYNTLTPKHITKAPNNDLF